MLHKSRPSLRPRWRSHLRLRFEPLEERRLLSFTLTAPTSGVFVAGDTVTIKWTASDVTPGSKISLCYDKDTVWGNGNETWIEIDGVTAADGAGSYSWKIANVPVGRYYVAGYLWDGGSGFTLSHLTEAITIKSSAPAFALTSPMTGTFASGETIPIQWTAANVGPDSKISLCYDKDTVWNNGNETWIEIDGVKATNGAGTYNWNTTGLAAGTYYVAGYMWDGGSTFNLSHMLQPITVIPPLTFVLSGPTSGTYDAGTAVNIQWTADNITTGSKISLCYDEDTTFSGNNEHWIEIDGITAADGAGSYTWDTTGVTPGTYYMAGYLWDGNNTFTFSHLTQSITITAAQGLTVESSAVKPQTADALTAGELAPIVAAAESRLAATLGNQVSTVLAGVSFEIDDLPGGLLGETAGNTIRIDCDGAGYGWFVDPTPADNSEFTASAGSQTLTARKGSPAYNRADLLTTVMHEMGHELGLVHDDLGDLMSAALPLGVRRTFITPIPDPSLS